MANELTYIIGAGASFQSIPIVKTFPERFIEFKNFLHSYKSNSHGKNKDSLDKAINLADILGKDFSSHQSFDTYFKKLFHKSDFNSINNGKRLLNLYFLWEHSSASIHQIGKKGDDCFKKQSIFDKRYDALIAGLLLPIPGKPQTICMVNFITWNYDINLLNSLKQFFYPDTTYLEFFQKIQKNAFCLEIDNCIRIINLNGSFYSSSFNEFKNLSEINGVEVIKDKVYSEFCAKNEGDVDADRLRFAWEMSKEDVKELNNSLGIIINNTNSIVVIGYTFPVYNRVIDFMYLKQSTLLSKGVTIQDPNSVAIKQTLVDVYRISEQPASIIHTITNCDSFYIPTTAFEFSDYSPFDKNGLSWT